MIHLRAPGSSPALFLLSENSKKPGWSLAFPAILVLAASCRTPLEVPRRAEAAYEHGLTAAALERPAEVWISYQIEIEEIDGVRTDYRAREPGLYFLVTLPAGEHRLGLRLNYQAPLQIVRSETVELSVDLAAGEAYRLFDLNAGRVRGRVLAPWLEPGAPAEGAIPIERPTLAPLQ